MMVSCSTVRDRLSELLDGVVDAATARDIRDHVERCADCRELQQTLELITDTLSPLDDLEPPSQLEADIAVSPCRRWLGLLYRAVDRDIGERRLERLLGHLESCDGCRRAWNDLTLIHQIGDALEPPAHLLDRCIAVRHARRRRPVISRRTATAAAYALAVSASLMIGNPVSIARSPVLQQVTETVTLEVSQAAEQGRGEIRVMLWRAWRWTGRQVTAVRELVRPANDSSDFAAEQGERS